MTVRAPLSRRTAKPTHIRISKSSLLLSLMNSRTPSDCAEIVSRIYARESFSSFRRITDFCALQYRIVEYPGTSLYSTVLQETFEPYHPNIDFNKRMPEGPGVQADIAGVTCMRDIKMSWSTPAWMYHRQASKSWPFMCVLVLNLEVVPYHGN